MKRILIIPIGSADPAILKTISDSLEKTFHCMTETGTEMPIPLTSYDPRRNQYYSSTILETLRGITRRDRDRILGVAYADLFVTGLNFVFGEADALAGVAVISLTRLRLRWAGYRKVRQQVCKLLNRRIRELGWSGLYAYQRSPALTVLNPVKQTARRSNSFSFPSSLDRKDNRR
jgi:predicted Zn-dependent protease